MIQGEQCVKPEPQPICHLNRRMLRGLSLEKDRVNKKVKKCAKGLSKYNNNNLKHAFYKHICARNKDNS